MTAKKKPDGRRNNGGSESRGLTDDAQLREQWAARHRHGGNRLKVGA